MFDHTGIVVSDLDASKRSFEQALSAIGLAKVLEFPAAVTGHTDVAGFAPPRLRAHHHPNDCGAFVRDPQDHTIEAVSHARSKTALAA